MAVPPKPAKVRRDVVELSVESAAARLDAAHLRSEAASLRWTTKITVREIRRRRRSCAVSCAHAHRLRVEPVPSPWSRLLWRRPDADLDQVLVAISGRPG